MIYNILGSLFVANDGEEVRIPTPRLRAALALLLLQNSQPLSIDGFIDGLWGDNPPKTARAQIHTIVCRLRQALPPDVRPLLTAGQGTYRLRCQPGDIDAVRFSEALGKARTAVGGQGGADSIPLLRTALGLWRGQVLCGVEAPFAVAARVRLAEERRVAYEVLADLELDRSNHTAVIPELASLLAVHPYWENIAARLSLALYRGGRQADALAVVGTMRRRLADDLGIYLSAGLRDLEAAILRHDVPAALVPVR
jgi:DNA-binding SARP family transcriptional activator